MFRPALVALTLLLAPNLASAQAQRSPNEARERAELSNFWNAFRTLRSECHSAAWTLWQSNGYDQWRSKKVPVLSMHYNTRTFEKLPTAPQAVSDSLREGASKAMQSANDIITTAGKDFSVLANYVNAKDFEDDKFKKGDEINRRLIESGRACFTLARDMEKMFTAYVQERAPLLATTAPDQQTAAQMIADWQLALSIARELAKNEKVDLGLLAASVAQISEIAEKRLSDEKLAKLSFYKTLNKDIAVELRKTVREAKESAKTFKELAADRPRSRFTSLRETITMGAGNELLSDIVR